MSLKTMIFNMSIGFIGISLAIAYITPASLFIVLGFIYFVLNDAFNEI